MELDEDDIFEVMLVNLRLAALLDLHDERKILVASLLRGGVDAEVVAVWQQTHRTARQLEVAELHHNLADYAPTIQAFPAVFAEGVMNACCENILCKAAESMRLYGNGIGQAWLH
jgi:hypothetical protein